MKEGRTDEIVKCTKDTDCIALAITGGMGGDRCTKNPNLGEEECMPEYWPKPMEGQASCRVKIWGL